MMMDVALKTQKLKDLTLFYNISLIYYPNLKIFAIQLIWQDKWVETKFLFY